MIPRENRMEKTFQTLIELETAGPVTHHAIGGALALICDTEPIETETLADASLQSPLQFRRMARGVENGKHGEGIVFDREVNGIFLEPAQANFPRASANALKKFRVGQCPLEGQLHFQFEFAPEAGTLPLTSSTLG